MSFLKFSLVFCLIISCVLCADVFPASHGPGSDKRIALDNAAAADRPKADQGAKDSGNFFKSVMGQTDQMNQRLGKPVIDNTLMWNFSDNQSGVARLQCESVEKFLNIRYSVASYGNIDIMIRQDLDLDGFYDTPYVVVNNVSGVCVNGLVFCDTGWANCTYKKWSVDNSADHPAWESSAVIALDNANYADMGGCTCYNDACAPSGMTTFPHGMSYIQERILSALGAGVVSMLGTAVPGYGISGGEQGIQEITYAGNNRKTCSGAASNLAPDPAFNPSDISSGYGKGRDDSYLATIATAKRNSDAAMDAARPLPLHSGISRGVTGWDQLANLVPGPASEITPCTIEHTFIISTARDSWCTVGTHGWPFEVSYPAGSSKPWVNPGAFSSMVSQNCANFYATMDCLDGQNAIVRVGNISCCNYEYPWSQTVFLPTLGTLHLNNPVAGSHTFSTDYRCDDDPEWSSVGVTMVSLCPSNLPCTYEFYYAGRTDYGYTGTVRISGQGEMKDIVNLVVSKNSCTQVEKDNNCRIWNETVDGAGGGCNAGFMYDSSLKVCVNTTTGAYENVLSGEKTVVNGVVQPGVVYDLTGNRRPSNHTNVCLTFTGYLMHSICENISVFSDSTTGQSYIPVGTPPFWKINREYKCSQDNSSDLDDIWARLKYVQDSAKTVGGIGSYKDQQFQSGVPSGASITDQSAYMAAVSDNCSRRCKVEFPPADDSQETGNQQTKQTGTTSIGTKPTMTVTLRVLRECVRVGGPLNPTGAWECPYNPAAGEIVVPIGGYECACTSDGFSRAASDISNLREMTKDLSCTGP